MTHKHDDNYTGSSGMFGHHDSRYNAEKILRNLLLIQEHYAEDPCADCLCKHWSMILAYAQEGLTLDDYKSVQDLLYKTMDVGNRHFKVIVQCAVKNVCKVKNQDDRMRMLQEVRSLRKEISIRIYGLVGDVTHDAFEHDYSKAIGADLHEDTRGGIGQVDSHDQHGGVSEEHLPM